MPPKRNFAPTWRQGVGTLDTEELEGTSYFPDAALEAALEHQASEARGDRSILAWLRRRLSPSRIDPNKPHEFVSLDSLTAAGRAAATSSGGAMAAAVLFAESDAHEQRCRLPGCGRPVDDPIHL